MHAELAKARAMLGCPFPEPYAQTKPTHWYRVDADWGDSWRLVGDAKDRIGYLALADQAHRDGCKATRVSRCEPI